MASKTRYVEIIGKCKWARNLFVPDEKYDTYYVDLFMDEENTELVKSLNLQGSFKEDADFPDLTGYRFRRPQFKIIAGKEVEFGKPEVTLAEGVENGIIGDGSTLCATIEVYETRQGVGNRLRRVVVLDRVDPPVRVERVEGAVKTGTSKTVVQPW